MLENQMIGQSAAKLRIEEGSTTISKESTKIVVKLFWETPDIIPSVKNKLQMVWKFRKNFVYCSIIYNYEIRN